MKITNGKLVEIEFTLKNSKGEIIDTSEGSEPLAFIQGGGSVVAGLEKALENKQVGFKGVVTISPEDGYGDRDEDLVFKVTKAQLGNPSDLEVGIHISAETEQGEQHFLVRDILENEVILDANHPFAGETMTFDVKVITVKQYEEKKSCECC